ncbi:hypothetical protein [Tropicibacter sp. Alg240-R139]|uniref:hypothetical protein n=1 Tax=Tropicibacter sp. Alg240-R139 TaxID=2305991 RepID=UPI0013DFDC35|nr:hypothetical protein [Tropicibacter sp. Alg240-R139]
MARTLKDLALALLNATLLLLALCLFLAWKVGMTVDGLTATFSENLIKITPLRDEVAGLRSDLSDIHADLAAIKTQSGAYSAVALNRLQQKVEALETNVQGVQSRVRQLVDTPELLIDHTIETAADALTRSISDVAGCARPK